MPDLEQSAAATPGQDPDQEPYEGHDEHRRQGLAALGRPAGDTSADTSTDDDFAGEHEHTAVDRRIISGTDAEREEESPRGWSGMDPS